MRVLANSIPKAGTHLLKRCLDLMPGVKDAGVHLDYLDTREEIKEILAAVPDSGFVTSHLTPAPSLVKNLEQGGFLVLLMVRDPRDIVISYVHFVLSDRTHFLHDRFAQMQDFNERLLTTIRGIKDGEQLLLLDINSLCRGFLQWQDLEFCRTIRFEDLIGPKGGGTAASSRATIKQIAHHLGFTIDDRTAASVAKAVFHAESPTFRKGVVGSWRQEFTGPAALAMEELAADLISVLGYPRDERWKRLCTPP